MAENMFTRLMNTASGAFREALEALNGDEEKVRQLATTALQKAVQDYKAGNSLSKEEFWQELGKVVDRGADERQTMAWMRNNIRRAPREVQDLIGAALFQEALDTEEMGTAAIAQRRKEEFEGLKRMVKMFAE